jgi:uncharacterized protein
MTSPLNDSELLLTALQRPDAFPHPVDAIRVAETHISWVLLTGEFAYKLKKPVKLGFLDFSTQEKRRNFCEEELRLNRRYSPDLYLDVVPITGTIGAPRIAGDGEPIEYAVRMRQFPDDALLSRQLRANRVTRQHIDALARVIAEFHRDAAVAAIDSPWGTCEAVWLPVTENFEQSRASGSDSPAIRRLSEWSRSEFDRLRAVFDRRRRDGFVRECHGDLHANNILLLNDQPRMFDCVEFNDSFRWVDVLSDLAFLCMDLADFGRADFAQRLLNAYLEITGDYAGLAAWRFYLVYRAMVRAKVSAIRTQQAPDQKQREEAARDVVTYLELAEAYIQPSVPKLFITHGPAGSGKSTLTQPLLEALGAIRIRSDIERRRTRFETSEQDRYSEAARQRVYEHMERLAELVLGAGIATIADATFLSRAMRARFHRLAERLSVEFVILDFQAPPEILRERVARRQSVRSEASEADVAVLTSQLKSAEPLDADERDVAIIVDTMRPDVAEALVRHCLGNARM